MEPWHLDDQATIYHGDCLEVLRELPDASVDSVVTDPPYGLEFMGKEWDSFRYSNTGPQDVTFKDLGPLPSYSPNRRNQKCPSCGKWAYDHPGRKCECGGWKQPAQRSYASAFGEWCELWAAECLRVLKPGGHLLAFGGTRTWHRLAVAIEDAGFEIRDSIAWMYGSGFPKSKNVALGIDKGEGHPNRGRAIPTASTFQASDTEQRNKLTGNPVPEYEAKSEAARRWQGWGTALKPAHEPVVVARKPLTGTVAGNVLEHGTGALNIDGCRIASTDGYEKQWDKPVSTNIGAGTYVNPDERHVVDISANKPTGGRWPANVVLDEDQAAALDRQSGVSPAKAPRVARKGGCRDNGSLTGYGSPDDIGRWPGDAGGGASRFFYVAKAPARERPKVDGIAHPTVKPLTLMRWLCRLVTPPGGVVLEPFAGSGTTIEAALLEGFQVVAIEREPDYLPLIAARLERVAQEPDDGQLTFDASA